jgi:methylthioribulose-1-phosphate dehydratase
LTQSTPQLLVASGNLSRKSPHPYPSPLTVVRINELISCALDSNSRGWHPGTAGNFSVREGSDRCWISPSSVHKGRLHWRDFVPVDLQSNISLRTHGRAPSAETALHTAIYRFDPKASAVIHAHPRAVTSLIHHQQLFTNNELIKVFGFKNHEDTIQVPCIPNTQDMSALGQELPKQIDLQSRVFVLENHGVYAWGNSPSEALYRIEALEFLCQTALELAQR